jgi:hypothetical protein
MFMNGISVVSYKLILLYKMAQSKLSADSLEIRSESKLISYWLPVVRNKLFCAKVMQTVNVNKMSFHH